MLHMSENILPQLCDTLVKQQCTYIVTTFEQVWIRNTLLLWASFAYCYPLYSDTDKCYTGKHKNQGGSIDTKCT